MYKVKKRGDPNEVNGGKVEQSLQQWEKVILEASTFMKDKEQKYRDVYISGPLFTPAERSYLDLKQA